MLLTKNVNPKIVSEMLGHSSIAITLDTYSHVLPTMQESAVRALEEILGKEVSTLQGGLPSFRLGKPSVSAVTLENPLRPTFAEYPLYEVG